MLSHKRLPALALAALVLLAAPGCSEPEDYSDLIIPYVVEVTSSKTGFQAKLRGGDRGAGWELNYSGVTAFRANHKLQLKNFVPSPDGLILSFQICSESMSPIERLWMLLKLKGGPELLTPPHAVNAKQQQVFVIGPLAPGDCRTITLAFDNVTAAGYTLLLDFAEVMERVAYASNRPDPGASLFSELFTVNPRGSDAFRVTRDAEAWWTGTPSWAPGGELIAFEHQEMITYGPTTALRVQAYVAHPDGSHLTRISEGLNYGYDPVFNPNGRVLAFNCKSWDSLDISDICTYNLVTGELKILISGSDFYENRVHEPRWSPDGKYLVMRTDGPKDGSAEKSWLIAEVDPWTGDLLSPPRVFARARLQQTLSDGTYRHTIWGFAWAPDSRHAAIKVTQYRPSSFDGLAIIDMTKAFESDQPVVFELTKVATKPEGETLNFPNFEPSGRRLFFDLCYDYTRVCDIQFVKLENYQPAEWDLDTGWPIRHDFIANGFWNRTPAPMKPIFAKFYPPRP